MASVVALAGFMGSGKSTVGRALAHRLGWAFVDLDRRIVDAAGRDIPTIFFEEGEAGFRSREEAALAEVLAEVHTTGGLVLSLGGGTPLRRENAALLARHARVVLLDVDAETAWSRVEGSSRPLARAREDFVELLKERRPEYARSANVVVDVGGRTVAETVEAVVGALRAIGEDI